MSWRVIVISNRAKLELKLNYLVIRNDNIKKVYLKEISTIIIESTAVSITASLMVELSKRKIKVIFCDEKRNPCFEVLPYYGSYDTSAKIRSQIAWNESCKKEVWTEIVKTKIYMQYTFLKFLNKDEAAMLKDYISQVELYDTTNREGHAAKVYFNSLFGKEFSRQADNVINAALNYGYSIILSAFNREIVSNGYLTQLGLFHSNIFNDFNLGSDLMEPYRILVDRIVYKMNPDDFSKEEKMELVDVLNDKVMIDGRIQYVNNAIRIYTKSIFDSLNNLDLSLIREYSLVEL